jgi:methionyl-tRNA formyltransferase
VYWKWLLSKDVLDTADSNVNFHPALLPIGRGWYPHVQSFMNGTPTGVTIHVMDSGMDTGPLWAQREVPIEPYDTCYSIYFKLQSKLISLFQEIWPKILKGEISPISQDESKAIVYTKEETNVLDVLDLDAPTTARKVINQLRSRSFGKKGFLYYIDNGKKVYVTITLSPTPEMS